MGQFLDCLLRVDKGGFEAVDLVDEANVCRLGGGILGQLVDALHEEEESIVRLQSLLFERIHSRLDIGNLRAWR